MKLQKSKIIISAVCLVLAVALAVTVCFAWFGFTKTSKINPWEAELIAPDAKISVKAYKLTKETDEAGKETGFYIAGEEFANSAQNSMANYEASKLNTAVLFEVKFWVAESAGTYRVTINRPKDTSEDKTRGVEVNADKTDPTDTTKPDFLGLLSFAIGVWSATPVNGVAGKYELGETVATADAVAEDADDKKILVNDINGTAFAGKPVPDESTNTNLDSYSTAYFIMDYNESSLNNVFAAVAQKGGGLSSTIQLKNDMTVVISKVA